MERNKYLTDRVAMVTGGASGMGRATALALAEAGAHVVIGSLLADRKDSKEKGELVYMPGQEELDKTAKEITKHGVICIAMPLDVTDIKSVEYFYDSTIDKFGTVDILVNAAGITAEQTVCGHTDELWNKVIDVNLNGPFYTTRMCLPTMIAKRWGRIIHIASTAASVGAPTSAAYCASKAGLVGFMKAVALEGAEHGVTCNTISPGWVETSFGKDWMSTFGKEYIDEAKAENPQKRMIQPSEIGALAAHLCRKESVGITMQDLTVSAGSLW